VPILSNAENRKYFGPVSSLDTKRLSAARNSVINAGGIAQVSHSQQLDFGNIDKLPVLWGTVNGNDLGPEPALDRMEMLDSWIKYLSDDKRLEQIDSKTLMIYEGGVERWGDRNLKNDKAKFCNTKCDILIGPHDMALADGILFIRDWYYNSDVHVPDHKLKILSFLESPRASSGEFKHPKTVVASYNRGSDIVIPYGKWISKPTNVSVTENRNYAAGKSKMAAAFTSNCATTNDRMDYITTLQAFITVDVYGACGPLKCPRSTSQTCFEKLKKDYKFYLAFENANCKDYITEKLYLNAYQNDVVPVVLGGHPYDYKAMAPPHSYIHVEDFDSPEDLANYLKVLDGNDTLYNEYFKWKNTGMFYFEPHYASTLCRMCAMLHYADYTKTAPPIRKNQIWSTFDKCLPNSKWYWEKED